MPKIDFRQTDKLDDIPGIRGQLLSKIKSGEYFGYKVSKLSDIKPVDLKKLPTETYLTITLTRGSQYSREEVAKVAEEFMKKTGVVGILAGSYRRLKKFVNDIDIVSTDYTSINPSENIKIIRSGLLKVKLLYRPNKSDEFYPIDILFTTPERYPFALMHFTGSKEFNIHMSKHAIGMGYRLSQLGLFKNETLVKGIKSEKDIFKALKLPYRPPEKRNI